MTVSRNSKQVKDKTKKRGKNRTSKLQHVGGGPIDFIQWIFGKILSLFTFHRTHGYETMNTHPPTPKRRRFYLVKENQPRENVIDKSNENKIRFWDRNNPDTFATVTRRFKLG